VEGVDEILRESGMDVGALGARFGLSPEQTRSAVASLMPAVIGGFQHKAQANDLDGVAQVATQVREPSTLAGNDVLGQIFGSKDVSRQVAGHAAGQSGVSNTVMKALLPIVAAMVAQHFAKKMGGVAAGGALGGGLGGILGSILGGQSGGLPGGFGDARGGSNPLEDILGGLGRR